MDNYEAAAYLDEIGDLLEIIGESSFRVIAYRRAARIIRASPSDINDLRLQKGGLTNIEGVGKGIAERLEELLDTGKMTYFEELKAKLPPSLADLVHIQGLGPKKAKQLYEQLGIASIADLEAALEKETIRDLPGMGIKTEENIKRGLDLFKKHSGRLLLNQAVPTAQRIVSALKRQSGVLAAEAAGSLRRRTETIGDIDILAATDAPRQVASIFCGLPDVATVLAEGASKCSVLLHSGLQVDLRMVAPDQYGAALIYFTGSKAHNVHLRQLAKEGKAKLSEYGLFKGDAAAPIASRTETDVYSSLGLAFIPPEMREDNGEIEAARDGQLPELIESEDIMGDLHAHTDASDGQSTIEEMAEYARGLGYHYLGISDHANNLKIARGLEIERLKKQWLIIDKLNSGWKEFKLLKGIELNIDNDGGVDYPDDILACFDIVSASIHSGFSQDKARITYRTIAAMENPHINIVCHPTGRVLGRRPGYAIELPEVFEAAARTGTFLELNAFPDRLDLNADHLREARRLGVRFSIGTDAHHYGHLKYMRYGIDTARRAWLEKSDVVNTYPIKQLLDSVSGIDRG